MKILSCTVRQFITNDQYVHKYYEVGLSDSGDRMVKEIIEFQGAIEINFEDGTFVDYHNTQFETRGTV